MVCIFSAFSPMHIPDLPASTVIECVCARACRYDSDKSFNHDKRSGWVSLIGLKVETGADYWENSEVMFPFQISALQGSAVGRKSVRKRGVEGKKEEQTMQFCK